MLLMRQRRAFLALLGGSLFRAPAAAGPAMAEPGAAASEADLKAAMLFNFTKFMEWSGPKGDAKAPLVIGVAGDDPVRQALGELVRDRGATGGGNRPLQLRRVDQGEEADGCHLLGARKRQTELLNATKRGVVTIGDSAGFTKGGGTIGFIVVENKLRFEVNLASANQAGVTISSRLLRLASEVTQ
jgi:hypothetical protein